jgi:hypothetical protein
MKTLVPLLLAALFAFPAALPAAELRIGTADTMESVLRAQKGRVTVRLRSGQELTGIVRSADGKLVHIGTLQGKEFFDAVVSLDAIEAVIVRTKE